MIVVIDNYDSFVHNLARLIRLCGYDTKIIRNDLMKVDEIMALDPKGIVISPGPGSPKDAGVSLQIIKEHYTRLPILGVCLGHQCIGEAFGGVVCRARHPMHGISSKIRHTEQVLFKGLPNPMTVGRYHSLIVELEQYSPLDVTATSVENEIMAIQHRAYPVFGVQFHPESILTDNGLPLLLNFLRLT